MANPNDIKKWKKVAYIDAQIVVTDWFYAKTPDLRDEHNFPFSSKAEYTTVSQNVVRSTIEEVDQIKEREEHEKMAQSTATANTK